MSDISIASETETDQPSVTVPDLASLVAEQLSGFALSDESWLVIDASPDGDGGVHAVMTVYAPLQNSAKEEVVEFVLDIRRPAVTS